MYIIVYIHNEGSIREAHSLALKKQYVKQCVTETYSFGLRNKQILGL